MRKYMLYLVTIVLLAFPIIAFGQVDTLILVEINSIEIEDEITILYTEDLNDDSFKELILCTDYFIYIYNGSNNELLWTSPPLSNPQDLLFNDINHDGLLDISVRDDLNIYLFDPHNFNIIWTGAELDSTYHCYTIGDINDDEWDDILIVSKEAFTNDSTQLDTVWIDIYNGPAFNVLNNFYLNMPNYDNDSVSFSENPTSIKVLNFMDEIRIFVFTETWFYNEPYPESWAWHWTMSGKIWCIEPFDFNCLYVEMTGFRTSNIEVEDGFTSYFAGYEYTLVHHLFTDYYRARYINSFDMNSFYERVMFWESGQDDDLTGYILGDTNEDNDNIEMSFLYRPYLTQLDVSNLDTLWHIDCTYDIDTLIASIQDYDFLNSLSLLCKLRSPGNIYRCYDGSTGSLTGIIQTRININEVVDLDDDSKDEIISIDSNTLCIYNLDYFSDVDQSLNTPNATYMQPNYPNPFNATTIISYELAEHLSVSIDVYNILGQKVTTLINRNQVAGQHHVIWNADNFPSGVYFYKLQADDYIETKSMLLLK
ncbi:MAG: T9SS type A sorting domain-containing protein [candidate division Zixibacteria bacterium]|nr:T9SS type A sorting domain-containing protein [candidate division Zixibacteria bacterium]